MANKKFSEFELKTTTSNVSHIVGYNGGENVRITPANFLDTTGGPYLPLAGGIMSGDTKHNDNTKSIWGRTGNDLEIYHDGSNSYVSDVGSGGLRISTNQFRVYNAAVNELMINANENSSVELYYDDSKKFETTNTGISVTGTVTADSYYLGSSNSISLATTGAGNIFLRPNGQTTSGQTHFNSSGDATFSGNVNLGDTSNTKYFGSLVNLILNADADGNSGTGSRNIIFQNRGVETMRLDASGNLLIGTSSDLGKVTIQNDTANQYALRILRSTSTTQGLGGFYEGSSNQGELFLLKGDNTITTLINSDGDSYLNGGNLGIGTSTTVGGALVIDVTATSADSDISAQATNTIAFSDNDAPSIIGKSTADNTTGLYVVAAASDTNSNADFRLNVRQDNNSDFTTLTTPAFDFTRWSTSLMTILRNGNLGVGTSSPDALLHISQASSNAQLIVERTGNATGKYQIYTNTNNLYFNNLVSSSIPLTILDNGRIGMGNVDPDVNLEISGAGASYPKLKLSNPSQTGRYLQIGMIDAVEHTIEANGGSTFLTFKTEATEKMRISSGGNVLFGATDIPDGTSNYGSGFVPVSTGKVQLRMASNSIAAGTLMTFNNPNGVVGNITITGSTTAYNTSSDYRLKEDLQDFKGVDLVSKISVYDYKWKSSNDRSYGVMAHELEEVLPQAVSGEKDAEEMQSVDYSKIVPLLVKSIQELKAEIELLKNK